MTEQDWVRKGVPLSNTTIAAISSKETQSGFFLGLHYSKEHQVADFAPRDGYCKSSPCSAAVDSDVRYPRCVGAIVRSLVY